MLFRSQKIYKEFKRLVKIKFDSIDYYFDIYLESKKIQQFRDSFLNHLEIFEERERLQSNDALHLQDYFNNYFEPNIFMFISCIDDILEYPKDYKNVLKYFQKFMKLCIQHADIKLEIMWQSNPIELLKDIKKNWESKQADIRLIYDSEMHAFTLQHCPNIKEVLKLIPRINSKDITEGWQKWHDKNKRKNAAIKIQRAFLQWLFRPGGNFMKNAESHFRQIASTVCT